MERPALFRGTGEGITTVFNPNAQFHEILEFLKGILEERKTFFSGGTVTVDPNGVPLGESEINLVKELFQNFGVEFKLKGGIELHEKEELAAVTDNKESVVMQQTLRSGQCINSQGNVVILGDVNEGAEINTTKSVYVFGIIRGIVNAGDHIVSLGFQPLRMTINGIQFDEKFVEKTYRKPRIAQVVNGKIVIKILGEKKSLRRK